MSTEDTVTNITIKTNNQQPTKQTSKQHQQQHNINNNDNYLYL